MELNIGDPFVLGVNYWPRRKAMYWWQDFDAAEVREEFALIRELGMTVVRIFLLWDDWQPKPDVVSLTALDNLETVANIAADLGLKLDVTFFTGHMSGPNWAPEWMLRQAAAPTPKLRQLVSRNAVTQLGYTNPYTDAEALQAAELLLARVVGRLSQHPGIGIWNLGNEPDLFAWAPDPATGQVWAERMVSTIRRHDPTTATTCGLHVRSLLEDNGLRVDTIFNAVDHAVMHGYPMYADWARDPLDPWFVPYLCAITSALCGKPTLMEEFGGCTNTPGKPSEIWRWTGYGQAREQFMASETALADYLAQVLPNLQLVGATGAVLWCFADYHESLHDRPPCDESLHERFFGLVRPDGSLKPHAEVVKKFVATQPKIQLPRYSAELDISTDEYYADATTHCADLYAKFLQQIPDLT